MQGRQVRRSLITGGHLQEVRGNLGYLGEDGRQETGASPWVWSEAGMPEWGEPGDHGVEDFQPRCKFGCILGKAGHGTTETREGDSSKVENLMQRVGTQERPTALFQAHAEWQWGWEKWLDLGHTC